jgi:hypothetical protein
MSLDTYKLHKLQGKGFDQLYSDHIPKWTKMVQKTADGVWACVGDNDSIKVGDVIAAVAHGIKISNEFEHHLAVKKLTQQYWAHWFAEYVVEKIYPHAEIKKQPGGNQ